MLAVNILLNEVEKVKRFVNLIEREEAEFDIKADNHYIIDAKSIMGLFSLNLSKPVTLITQEEVDSKDFKERFKEFIVD